MKAINPDHPMSQLIQDNAAKFIACVIWKLRAHCPNLAIEITMQDMEDVARVFMANGQNGCVACIGKSDRVVLQLMDGQTGQALLADTALDENSPNARMMARSLDARKRAPEIADRLLQFRNVNDRDLMREAAETLRLLTWEPD